ncbi:MAG: hypothetical protein B1H08_01270 [Candidatus Omnitrophica bacterium 4484_171]|nr:MAG: hypothetical protein B1H08_01270 [Candidatus Omnitrophica bacterium 4484_171]
MGKYRKTIITVVIVILGVLAILLYSILKNKKEETHLNNGQLYIENYIFTKLTPEKALIRIYGTNRGNNDVSRFPVIIKYYTKNGKYLGKDESDLLRSTKAVLKAGGKFNAQVSVLYPKNTGKVEINIKHN